MAGAERVVAELQRPEVVAVEQAVLLPAQAEELRGPVRHSQPVR